MKTLIVEDDADVLDLVSKYVRDRWPEAEIITAQTGKEALKAVDRSHPDLLLLDIGLPDMKGWVVFRRVRATSDIPVVIITGSEQDSDIGEFLKGEPDAYLTKPFAKKALIESIEGALGVRREGETTTWRKVE